MSESPTNATPDLSSDYSFDLSDDAPVAPVRVPAEPRTTRTLTNSPGCTPAPASADDRTRRRMRTVRVDAWAVPASASWTRTRRTVRKVRRTAPSSDWALPF